MIALESIKGLIKTHLMAYNKNTRSSFFGSDRQLQYCLEYILLNVSAQPRNVWAQELPIKASDFYALIERYSQDLPSVNTNVTKDYLCVLPTSRPALRPTKHPAPVSTRPYLRIEWL